MLHHKKILKALFEHLPGLNLSTKVEAARHKLLLDAIVENSPLAIFVKDAKDRFNVLLWNRAAERIFELPREKMIGKNAYDFWPKEQADFFHSVDEKVMAGGQIIDIPEEASNSGSRGVIYLHTRKLPLTEGNSRYLLCLCDDITERRRNEETLRAHQAKLIASSKMVAVGAMSSGIAHEINNPLAIIHGKANLLKKWVASGAEDTARVAKLAEEIEATALRISKIVKSLRTIAREAEYDPYENVSATEIIDETLDLCRERFRSHDIELTVTPTAREVRIDCRPVELSQVLLNLLNNAYDAVQKIPKKWVRIDVMEKLERVEIAVTDSGSGIPVELREKILEPFFTTKEVGMGTGLGLSISKALMESHCGKLKLDTMCENTRFVIWLPKEQGNGGEVEL